MPVPFPNVTDEPLRRNFENVDGRLLSLLLGVPVGAIFLYGGTTAPSGFLLCQGQQVKRATYPALDAVIGTNFGAYTNGSGGAGTTHMVLPNLTTPTRHIIRAVPFSS